MLQQQFNAAIGNGNWTHRRMVGSYMSANLSRQACYDECPKGAGYDSETAALNCCCNIPKRFCSSSFTVFNDL